jgi:MYXO-CTERM domain-containing protein
MPRLARAALAASLLVATARPALAQPDARPRPITIVIDTRLGDAPYWTSKGRELLDAGRPDQALPFAEKAVNFFSGDLGDKHPLPFARALFLLAEVREMRGEYRDALTLFERVERVYTAAQGPEQVRVAQALAGQSRVLAALGDHEKALPRCRRALSIAEKSLAPDDVALGDYIELLGEELDESGARDEAGPLLERALALYESAKKYDPIRVADALHNLGARSALLGEIDPAIALFRRSAELREKARGPDDPQLAQALEALSVLAAAKHDDAAALAFEERAVKILERRLGPMHPELIVPVGNIALAKLALRDPRGAEAAYARALGIAERHTSRVLTTGSEREKLAFLATVTPLADSFLAAFLRAFPSDPALARLGLKAVLRYKGRALDATVDSVGLLRRRLPAGQGGLLDELRKAQARLAALATAGPGDPSATSDRAHGEHRALLARIEELEAKISDASAAFRLEARAVDTKDVQAALGRERALVEIFAYARDTGLGGRSVPRYAAFVLRHEGPPVAVELGPADALDPQIQAFHDALSDPKRDDLRALGRALDERVMRPLRPALEGAKQIFLSPDRAMNLVPFEALIDEQGRAQIERFTFTYLASGRDLLRMQSARAPSRGGPLILANPSFDEAPSPLPAEHREQRALSLEAPSDAPASARGYALDALRRMRFTPLRGTAAEGEIIAKALPGARLHTGAEATKAALFASPSPSILHVATHGFFLPPEAPAPLSGHFPGGKQQRSLLRNDTLLRSGLAFAGANRRDEGRAAGLLTALEAAGLDLEGTRLVTLSACETGLGEIQSGDGVHGLRRALSIAGAETVAMSLWKVDDGATRDLMIAYYQRLRRGEGRSEALRSVKLAMLREPRTAHPYAWAGFIVSGDPSPIEGLGETSVSAVEPKRPGCACRIGERDERPSPAAFLGLSVAAIAVLRRRR